MGILVKYTLRNVKEHKVRTFLILISIMLSVGLFFGSLSISNALSGLIMDNIKSFIGTAEVYVGPGRTSEDYTIKVKDLGEVESQVEYSIGVVEYGVEFRNSDGKDKPISLKGFNLDELEIMNPVKFISFTGEDAFKGKTAIIGNRFAQKEALKVGDTLRLKFSDNDVKMFKIAGIAEDKGFFKDNESFGGDSTTVIVPRETLSRFLGSPNLVNTIYVKTADDTKVDETVEALKTVYKNETVHKMITQSELDAEIRPIRIPFMFMLLLVVIISTFIIYTSFKVITLERLPMLGTFRSIGATKKMTDVIMLLEAFIYGVLGSLLGCIIGHYFLKLLMNLMASDIGVDRIVYPVENLFMAFAFGVVLSVGSALVPIVKVSRIPVKEVLLNIIEGTRKKRKYLRYVIGGILGVLSFALPIVFSEGMMSAVSGALGIILLIAALVCFVPVITDSFIKLTEGMFAKVFGNIGLLAVKNMRGNKSTYDNIILLTIGLASMMTIGVLGTGIQKETLSEFEMQTYDIHVYAEGATPTTTQRILSVDGIQDSILYQESWNAFNYQGEEKAFLKQLVGVDNTRYLDFFDFDVLGHDDDKAVFESLLTGRKLVLGTLIRDKYKLKEGQYIELDTGQGMRTYEIVGFVNTKKANGQIGLTARRNLKSDLKQSWGLRMAIKVLPGYDAEQMVTTIEDKLKNLNWYEVETLASQKDSYFEENKKIIMILSAFSMATALIGSIGVMNNFLVSFLARKKALAIYASVGMSKVQKKAMILIEAVSGGLIGAVFGLITTLLILVRVNSLLSKIDVLLALDLSLKTAILGMVGSILVCLLSSLSVLRRSGKVSIIEELRYE